MPGVLSRASRVTRDCFEHDWAPMQALAQKLSCLPPQVWDRARWESGVGGFVIIAAGESCYRSGPVALGRWRRQNVAVVSIDDLAADNERPLHVVGHLIDHHLGSGGEAQGRWLSEGGGIATGWERAGERLMSLFALGHAVDDVARGGVRDYFAQSLALFCGQRQRLNAADPLVCKWFRSTLWSASFWKLWGHSADHLAPLRAGASGLEACG